MGASSYGQGQVTGFASAQSEDGAVAAEHVAGDIRANVMLDSERYELTATMTSQALTLHVQDKLTKRTVINVTLS